MIYRHLYRRLNGIQVNSWRVYMGLSFLKSHPRGYFLLQRWGYKAVALEAVLVMRIRLLHSPLRRQCPRDRTWASFIPAGIIPLDAEMFSVWVWWPSKKEATRGPWSSDPRNSFPYFTNAWRTYHCGRHWGCIVDKKQNLCPHGTHILVGDTDHRQDK